MSGVDLMIEEVAHVEITCACGNELELAEYPGKRNGCHAIKALPCEHCRLPGEVDSRCIWEINRDAMRDYYHAILREGLVTGDQNVTRLNAVMARTLGKRPDGDAARAPRS